MQIILVMHCPDKKGIIAAVTNFIHAQKGNIVYIDQHVDRLNKAFFMRVEVDTNGENIAFDSFKTAFQATVGNQFDLHCNFYLKEKRPKMALMVSKYDHCLYDILTQHQSGKLHCEIPLIISNHKDLEPIAERFEIPFYHVPVSRENKVEAETIHYELFQKYAVDFIILARYMQIITEKMIAHYPNKIINIQHSFLPAFPGAKPYHSAFKRGVKIIGATSHYVTEDLDAGPIIEQDTVRVSHAHGIEDFIAMGRDLERLVLLRAIKLHLHRKLMVYDNKTVVFT